jgi:hypothetical protein
MSRRWKASDFTSLRVVAKPVATRLVHLLAAVRFLAVPDFCFPFNLSWEGSVEWLCHPHDFLRALRLCTDLRDIVCRRNIDAGKSLCINPTQQAMPIALGAYITLLAHEHSFHVVCYNATSSC